jgi:flagellar motility protein MotE (MotC chaperone)
MLTSLPAELPLAMKRQTVTVALNAMGRSIGATPETIVADASRKLAALTAYTDNLSRQTSQTIVAAEDEIKALQAEIEAKRQEIAAVQQRLANAVSVCHAESDRLDDVLEFFSLDVPPSKHSPAESGSQGS